WAPHIAGGAPRVELFFLILVGAAANRPRQPAEIEARHDLSGDQAPAKRANAARITTRLQPPAIDCSLICARIVATVDTMPAFNPLSDHICRARRGLGSLLSHLES